MKTLYFHVYQDSATSAVFKFQLIEADPVKKVKCWSIVGEDKKYRDRWIPESFEHYGCETAEQARSKSSVILGLKHRA